MDGSILTWIAMPLVAFLLLITALPVIKTGHWVARVCDFPRLQILVACVIPAALLIVAISLSGGSSLRYAPIGVLIAIAIWQFSHIVRYTRYWPCEVPKQGTGEPLTAMIVNLDFENAQKEAVREVLSSMPVDVLLLIEIDQAWERGLESVIAEYPHRKGVVRDEGVGIVLLSKHPMLKAEVRHLVSKKRACVHATLDIGGQQIDMTALHPTPPGLKSDNGDRFDSRIRDAELVKIAKEIKDADPKHRAVLGDLNDVAWSHTTRLFRRLSGLRDPRIGRRLLSTYHAERPMFRYPLDHIFVSDEIAVSRLERLRIPGSDHFSVLATIHVPPGKKPNETNDKDAKPGDAEEAEEIEQEGHEEAAEHGS